MLSYYGQIVGVDPASLDLKVVYKREDRKVSFFETLHAAGLSEEDVKQRIADRVQALNGGHDHYEMLVRLVNEGKQIRYEAPPAVVDPTPVAPAPEPAKPTLADHAEEKEAPVKPSHWKN